MSYSDRGSNNPKILEFINNTQLRFVIPNFQRRYSWEKDNWKVLWENLVEIGEINNTNDHFLGLIVFQEENIGYPEPKIAKLIDGQQRISTILLLLSALKAYEKEKGISKNVINDELFYVNSDKEKHKLKMGELDKDIFEKILRNSGIDTEKQSDLKECFKYFSNKIKEKDDYYEKIIRGLEKTWIITLCLNKEKDSPQNVFETMNTTGKQLATYDLIRNYLILSQKDTVDGERLFKDYWVPLEKRYEGRLSDIEKFVFCFIGLKTGKNHDEKSGFQAYKTFKSWFKEDKHPKKTAEELFKEFIKNAHYYYDLAIEPIELKNRNGMQEVSKHLVRMLFLDLHVPYSFLLGVYDYLMLSEGEDDISAWMADYRLKGDNKDRINKDDQQRHIDIQKFIEITRIVESYYVRLNVCGKSVKTVFPNLFPGLHKKINESQDIHPYIDRLKREIYRIEKFPSEKYFEERFKNGQIKIPKAKAFILRCIEYDIQEKINEQSDDERLRLFSKSKKLTIEHIMPKNLIKEEDKKKIEKWIEEINDTDWFKIANGYMNNIGNLTLLSGNRNASLSDKPFKKKLDGYKTKSFIGINNYFKIKDVKRWDKKAILERSNELYENAKDIWKEYPCDKPNFETLSKIRNDQKLQKLRPRKIAYYLSKGYEEECDNWDDVYFKIFKMKFMEDKKAVLSLVKSVSDLNIELINNKRNQKKWKFLDEEYRIYIGHNSKDQIHHLCALLEKFRTELNLIEIELPN